MATNTAASFTNHTGNGTAGPFSISFSYLAESEVDVTVGGVLKTITTHYTFTSATQITFTSGNEPANGAVIKIQRDTNVGSKKIDFNDGSVLTESDLDTQNDQLLFAVQEITDNFIKRDGTKTVTGDLSFEGATDNTNETKLAITDPTADRTITLPDTTGTVVTTGDTGTVTSTMITDGTIVNADINASAAIAGSKLQAASGSNAGSMSASDKSKLDAIESSATGDQTNAEIRAAVEAASDSNVFTDADHSKLNAIEANADVTDATNVDAAGAVMNSDLDAKGEILVGDGSGDPTALPVGTNGYILTADSTEATGVKWAANAGGGGGGGGSGISNVVEDTTPQLGGNLDVQTREINTSTTNGNIKVAPDGTGLFEVKGNTNAGTLQLNCENNSHGVKIKSPAHSAAADYTLTLPVNVVNGQFLKTDTNGVLSWAAVDLTALSASNLTSGTVPDARFPATLPAASGTNLTNLPSGNLTGALPAISGASLTSLNASNLGSGTIPDARFPATLPAASATNLTAIPAASITGTLPAIDGSNLTGISATVAGGAIYENSATMSSSHTIASGTNGMSAGPITVPDGVTLTVSSGSVYTIV